MNIIQFRQHLHNLLEQIEDLPSTTTVELVDECGCCVNPDPNQLYIGEYDQNTGTVQLVVGNG